MLRRFVNIVAEKGIGGLYTLHRLDVSKHLFYPSTAEARAANATGTPTIQRLKELPPPVMTFEPDRSFVMVPGLQQFFALVSPRSSEGRVLCSNMEGNTVIYDADVPAIKPVPNVIGQKGFKPITISIARPGAPEEDLYVMSSIPDAHSSCFDVLRCGSLTPCNGENPRSGSKWEWEALPAPPYASRVVSHALLDDGRTICVSTAGKSTYCFDTVKREWSEAYEDWVLPFEGGAEYVPDLKLWLGFSPGSYLPCVSDLSSMDQSPTLKDTWADIKLHEDLKAIGLNLVNLGQRRFCIAKVFQIGEMPDRVSQFAVLSGFEMVTNPKEGLLMVNHKAIRYMFIKDRIEWVL